MPHLYMISDVHGVLGALEETLGLIDLEAPRQPLRNARHAQRRRMRNG